MHPQFDFFLQNLPETPETPCAYFPDRPSKAKAFIFEDALPNEYLSHLLNQGYRRCGTFYYKQNCVACNLCLGYRLEASKFKPSRSQKRIIKKNQDLISKIVEPEITDEKEELYLKYQLEQHHKKPAFKGVEKYFDREKTLGVMYEQMYNSPPQTKELEIYLGDRLICFGILDIGDDSVSAVYSVYNPDLRERSLGTFFILSALEWARQQSIHYFHLGYYIPNHSKMAYKANFKPAEILHPNTGEWVDAEDLLNLS